MSESITDELRKWAEEFWEFAYSKFGNKAELLAIAGRIDAEHERQLEVLYRDMSDAEYVKLPEDADGVPIRVGDVMVYADGNTKPMEVVALVPPAVFLTEEGPRYADICRHYHAPTVEDVLDDLVDKASSIAHANAENDMGGEEMMDALQGLVAEFAAKLRLVGEGE